MNGLLPALAMLQPRDADAAAAGIVAGCMGAYLLFVLAIIAFMVFCFWRIFSKAGYNGAMALICLIPGLGGLIVILILAFGDWPALRDRR